jgi:hypothetical protein
MTTRVTQVTHLPYVAIGARIENEQEVTSLASLSPQVPARPRSHAILKPGPLPVRIHNWNLSQALAFVAGVRVRVVALANSTRWKCDVHGHRHMTQAPATTGHHPGLGAFQSPQPWIRTSVPVAVRLPPGLSGGGRAREAEPPTQLLNPPIHEGKTR